MAEADPRKTFEIVEENELSRLVDRAHAGEEILLSKGGEPWAKIVPVEPPRSPRRRPGGLTTNGPIDLTAFLEPLPEEDLACIDDRPEAERG